MSKMQSRTSLPSLLDAVSFSLASRLCKISSRVLVAFCNSSISLFVLLIITAVFSSSSLFFAVTGTGIHVHRAYGRGSELLLALASVKTTWCTFEFLTYSNITLKKKKERNRDCTQMPCSNSKSCTYVVYTYKLGFAYKWLFPQSVGKWRSRIESWLRAENSAAYKPPALYLFQRFYLLVLHCVFWLLQERLGSVVTSRRSKIVTNKQQLRSKPHLLSQSSWKDALAAVKLAFLVCNSSSACLTAAKTIIVSIFLRGKKKIITKSIHFRSPPGILWLKLRTLFLCLANNFFVLSDISLGCF